MPFNTFERFIAFRYLRPLRFGSLLSIISWFSFTGICIGVATLIIVMSVMNGFRIELEKRILGFNGHIYIQSYEEYFEYDFIKELKTEGIKFIDPNISIQSLLKFNNSTKGVVIKSYIEENYRNYNFIQKNKDNLNTENSIVLGEDLANSLGIKIGDEVKIISSETVSSPFGQLPKSVILKVLNFFDSGMSEYDSNFAFMSLENAQKIIGINDKVSTIEIHINNLEQTDLIRKFYENNISNDFVVRDWREINQTFWEVLETERTVMFLILSLIIIVAAFNVITSLFILVKNKNKEIAILKTVGLNDNSILRIFLLVGSLIGISGTIIGSTIGILITIYLEYIRLALNYLFNINLFPSDFYYLDQIPTSVDISQLTFIIIFSVIVSILATIYPAVKASKLEIKNILSNV